MRIENIWVGQKVMFLTPNSKFYKWQRSGVDAEVIGKTRKRVNIIFRFRTDSGYVKLQRYVSPNNLFDMEEDRE